MSPPKVLLVEDDRDVRESMCDLLEDSGYDVMSAADGEKGLERLREPEKPAVVLLDLMMSGMDGYQFLAEMRRDPEAAQVPVVVLTAQGGPTMTSAQALGVAAVVRKPFEFDELVAVIRRHVLQGSPPSK